MNKNIIPTINISSIVKNGFENSKSIITINKIKEACINIGFFQIIGHGISQKDIRNICKIGNKFFKSSKKNKKKLAPKKWNKRNKNIYRGYFPNTVNGKEGLDLGDLKIMPHHLKKYNSPYIPITYAIKEYHNQNPPEENCKRDIDVSCFHNHQDNFLKRGQVSMGMQYFKQQHQEYDIRVGRVGSGYACKDSLNYFNQIKN